ncbi:MAG: tetratricopeptide repeat protein [Spirochaetales bacterium]|nr:tetratricopeptide repeat protein [Spirochaetales bacterium]
MKFKIPGFLLLLLLLSLPLSVSAADALEDEYLYGLDLFREARYDQALKLFRTVLDDPGSEDLYGDCTYWTARAYLESGDLSLSAEYLEEFLQTWPNHGLNIPGRYYKGRILFLQQEYDKCIHYFSSFLTTHPDTPYYANGLFWIGESLYSLGRFDEAKEIYSKLLESYPRSVKTEATRYKLSLIEYKYREEELLKLLQWSHEEFLKSSEDYAKKEKEFNQALLVYQEKLIELTRSQENYENRMKLLSLKEKALILKEQLLQTGGTTGE